MSPGAETVPTSPDAETFGSASTPAPTEDDASVYEYDSTVDEATPGDYAGPGGFTTRSLVGFNAGNLISDAKMYAPSTMSAAQIQAFLESKVPSCRSGYVCLKDYRQDTLTKAPTKWCPGSYQGARGESAAAIISKAAKACGVNEQVLLVMLQKEQGLVTHVWPSTWRYTIAMGYACPDNAACDTAYYGFQNQMYMAASQLKRYTMDSWFNWYPVGKVSNVRYHPNVNCGAGRVLIENKATAALYYYTPYQPNAAALAAGYREGDACSSYGNRNFYNYFTDWFGPTSPTSGVLPLPSSTQSGRVGGETRWDTSAAVSRATFAPGVSVAYIANARDFPDALASAAAAGHLGGPVLLSDRGTLHPSVAAELARLRPLRIVVIGGTGVISDSVLNAVKAYTAGSVVRVGGADRFATSVAISRSTFSTGVPVAYIANAMDFPDALAGASAAGHLGGPVLLTEAGSLNPSAAAELARLQPKRIVILGGAGVVGDAVAAAVKKYTVGTVTRLGGQDRWATSAAISRATFSSGVPVVYLASARDFPDALSGAAAAGHLGGPVLLTDPYALHPSVAAELDRLNPKRVIVLGGTGVISNGVLTKAASYATG